MGRIVCIGILLLVFASAAPAQTTSDRYPFIKDDKLGFIDGKGREVIPAKLGNAGDAARFREGLANVASAGGWGYIDESGKFIVDPKFWWTYPFS